MGAWNFDYTHNTTGACVWYRVPWLQSLGGYLLAAVCMACLHSTTLGPRTILLQPN